MTAARSPIFVALNVAADGALPASLLLIPAGPDVVGRDGRAWRFSQPGQVVQAFDALGQDLPIDIEHSTEIKAPAGEAAPAVGWIKRVEVIDGAIHAVDYSLTEQGRQLVESQAYRYLSPVILYASDTREIVGLSSVALTNKPNLTLPALNRSEEPDMDRASIAAALGIAATAPDADIVAAANRLRSAVDQPDPSRFVPRTDLDAALNRASVAETALNTQRAAQAEAEIKALIDSAVTDGKIAPASRDHYVALCRTEAGLNQVKALVASLPVIAQQSNLDQQTVKTGGTATAEQILARANNRIVEAARSGITLTLPEAVSMIEEGR